MPTIVLVTGTTVMLACVSLALSVTLAVSGRGGHRESRAAGPWG